MPDALERAARAPFKPAPADTPVERFFEATLAANGWGPKGWKTLFSEGGLPLKETPHA